MKIVSWNVNSIRARKDRVLAWLAANQPDVLCVQESKVVDEDFPEAELKDVGYFSAFHGQKAYNGVAIISKQEPSEVSIGFSDDGDDSQARFIGATVAGVRIYSAYVPNGGSVGSDKYDFKLEWLQRLQLFLQKNHVPSDSIVLCGDWNVAPDDRDVHDPALWEGGLLCTDAERAALQGIVNWGFTDGFRMHHEDGGLFSWWDYRMLGFPKNKGLRIDHLYLTDPVAARCEAAGIDRDERKGKGASDHAPTWVELA